MQVHQKTSCVATDKPGGVLYLSLLLEGADKIKLFVMESHNGCLTYVNVPTVSSKPSREGKALLGVLL